jgi:hypothetical protein
VRGSRANRNRREIFEIGILATRGGQRSDGVTRAASRISDPSLIGGRQVDGATSKAAGSHFETRPALASWVLVNLAILAAIDLVETAVDLLIYESSGTTSDLVFGTLVVAFLIIYPYLLVGAALYLAVLRRRVHGKRLPVTQRRALLLSPLVALPVAVILGISPSGTAPLWMAAGTIAYGLLVRLPPAVSAD